MGKKQKKYLLITIILLIFVFVITINSCGQNEVKYTNTLIEDWKEEYAPNFQLKKGLNYYSILKKHDENILLFWSSICPHCEKVIEYIKTDEVYGKIKDKIFTVSIDEDIDAVKQHSQDFPIYLDYNYKIFK